MSVSAFPTVETRIMIVRRIVPERVGNHLLRHNVEGVTLGAPPDLLQVSTLSQWQASMCERSMVLSRPLQVGFRNYGHGERRIVTLEWAS